MKRAKTKPPAPLFLRIVLIDTDVTRGEHKEIGPFWEMTQENLRAMQLCIRDLEIDRKDECDPIPAIRLVAEPLVINELLDEPFTKIDALCLMDDGREAISQD